MRFGCWFVLWLIVAGPLLARPPVIELRTVNTDTSIKVWNRAELLEDPTRLLSLQSVLALQPPLAFSSTVGRSPQLGFSQSDFWLRLRVRDDGPSAHQTWVLHILHFFANRLTLFLVDETTGLIVERHSGEGAPMSSWDMPYQEGAFRLTPLPGRTYTVLLRMSGTNSKAFTPMISEIAQYQQFIQWSTYSLAFFVGMLIFAVIVQLIFFGFTNERNFIFYALYLLSFGFVFLQNGNGLPGEVCFWPKNDWLNRNGIMLSSSLCSVFLLLFYSNGLKLKTHTPWIIAVFWAVSLSMIGVAVGILTGLLDANATQYVLLLGIISLGLALVACLISLTNGFKPARFYLLATLSFLIGMITTSLWHRGLVPINYLTTYSIPIGSLSEIIFFTLALADDYRRTQFQERQSQQKLIKALQEQNDQITTAQLQGQTLERQRVAADLHDNLGTTLSALHWNLEAMDTTKLSAVEQAVYATINQQVSQAYNDVRLLSHNLLPIELAKQGLAVALCHLVDKMNRNTAVRFRLIGIDKLPRLDQQTEFELYSICLELLNNTIKHAHATEGFIDLTQANGMLYMAVGDNGTGVDNQRKDGRGLQNVAARVDSLGGTWEVDSTLDRGVQNRISVPVRIPSRVS